MPGLNAYLLWQDLKTLREHVEQRLEERRQQQASETAKEEQEKAASPTEPLLMTERPGDESRDRTQAQTTAQSQSDRCHEREEGYDLEAKLHSIHQMSAQAQDQSRPILQTLREQGSTPAQKGRLVDIYMEGVGKEKSSPTDSPAITAYRTHMHTVAEKNGREVMDRAQSASQALATDREAFWVTLEKTNDAEASLQALRQTSPTMADLTPKEAQEYLEEVVDKPQSVNTMQRVYVPDQARGSGGVSEVILPLPTVLERGPLTPQEDRFFIAEGTDLLMADMPGQHLEAHDEYSRQLGTHIRRVGRGGISLSQEDCEDELTTDQHIAQQMYIAGYEKTDIKVAIQQGSPSQANEGDAAQKAYVEEQIEPVLEDRSLLFHREQLETWRDQYGVDRSIQRLDCLQLIHQATQRTPLALWHPNRIDDICPNLSSPSGPDQEPPEGGPTGGKDHTLDSGPAMEMDMF